MHDLRLSHWSDGHAFIRDYLDRALKAFELSKEHMWLFCQDKPSPMKESTAAGHAVQALDLLLEDLAGTSQVHSCLHARCLLVTQNSSAHTPAMTKFARFSHLLSSLLLVTSFPTPHKRSKHTPATALHTFTCAAVAFCWKQSYMWLIFA